LEKNINILLHRSSLPALTSSDSLRLLSQSLAKFFSDKIHKLHASLLINRISASPHFPPPFTLPNFSYFTCAATDEVSKPLSQSPDTNCDLDPIPISLLKQCSHILLPTITNAIKSLHLLAFLLINAKAVLHIHTSKNLTWIKMIIDYCVFQSVSRRFADSSASTSPHEFGHQMWSLIWTDGNISPLILSKTY